ncbi:MAG TPA: IlvD/Edd family dehydratase [Streptosporangiaceae bacterium]|nr:IlvD/Edd family dehydratase [Streptosporangiaceae bacterium]
MHADPAQTVTDRDEPLAGGTAAPPRRSASWFGAPGRDGFLHRSWVRAEGFTPEVFDGRPVIGIANSFSELAPCNSHLRELAAAVKRGVWQAGGFPLEFPTMSLGESLIRPTAMLYRNLMAMEVEESIRANPVDGVVLLCGCDKTTPAMLMAAASVDLPAIVVTGGPMLNGRFRGGTLGSGTAVWALSEDVRGGRMTEADFSLAEGCMSRSHGHCMTMGTASTMACMTEALGMTLPGAAAIPAVDAGRTRVAQASGQRITAMVRDGLRPSEVLTRQAFENAIVTLAAIGGSTNAIIHLLAIAGRCGVELSLDDFDVLSRDVPLLADLQPSGRHLMEDFADAGGLPVITAELLRGGLLRAGARTVTGRTVAENMTADEAATRTWRPEVIRTLADPLQPAGAATAVLRGNLCPDGAVIKVSAATPGLLTHRGRALVFDSVESYRQAADDDDLDVTPDDVLVLRYAGPRGYPGMPEVGNLPLPRRMLAAGVTDMVRVSDARMSGTAYGTVVLHAAPEAAAGGPIALVRTGDMISLDMPARTLHLEVPEDELLRRRAAWSPPPQPASRGWVKLYIEHVQQADRGCDLDFLVGSSGSAVPRPSH